MRSSSSWRSSSRRSVVLPQPIAPVSSVIGEREVTPNSSTEKARRCCGRPQEHLRIGQQRERALAEAEEIGIEAWKRGRFCIPVLGFAGVRLFAPRNSGALFICHPANPAERREQPPRPYAKVRYQGALFRAEFGQHHVQMQRLPLAGSPAYSPNHPLIPITRNPTGSG